MDTMTPQEALDLLDNIAQHTRLTRPEHVQVQTAVKILSDIIADNERRKEIKNE